MNLTKKISAAMALAGVLAMANLGAVQAEDLSSGWKTMKPLYAISIDVGQKHVLSYFLKEDGLCDLTMMVTDRPNEPPEGDEIPTLSTARFKAKIAGGKTVSFGFDTAEGKSLEYACGTDAQAMSVRTVNPVVVTSRRPLYPYRFNGTTVAPAGLGG